MMTRQAQIIAYGDDYIMMTCVTMLTLFLVLLMRRPGATAAKPEVHAAID
jgi:DHA2 family multidrug resistance protein